MQLVLSLIDDGIAALCARFSGMVITGEEYMVDRHDACHSNCVCALYMQE